MAKESTQHKLDRVRPPRVQITYDVEIGDAIEMKELPFVVGVMADLAGNKPQDQGKLKDRKFVEIDRDNFDDVLSSIQPRTVLQVDDKLSGDDKKFNIELKFDKMEDFDPVNVVNQVKPLKELLDARKKLSDLISKLDGNDDLDELLQKVVSETDELKKVQELVKAEQAEEQKQDGGTDGDEPSEPSEDGGKE